MSESVASGSCSFDRNRRLLPEYSTTSRKLNFHQHRNNLLETPSDFYTKNHYPMYFKNHSHPLFVFF